MVKLSEIIIDPKEEILDYLTNHSAVILMRLFNSLKIKSENFMLAADEIMIPEVINELIEVLESIKVDIQSNFSSERQSTRVLVHLIQYLNNT